jgi:hypothetical protein
LHIRGQEADLLAGLDGKKSDGEGQEARRGDVEKVENLKTSDIFAIYCQYNM